MNEDRDVEFNARLEDWRQYVHPQIETHSIALELHTFESVLFDGSPNFADAHVISSVGRRDTNPDKSAWVAANRIGDDIVVPAALFQDSQRWLGHSEDATQFHVVRVHSSKQLFPCDVQ
jgi:hypothetical protein